MSIKIIENYQNGLMEKEEPVVDIFDRR